MSFDSIDDSEHPSDHIKEVIIMTRLNLYNHNLNCGAKFIREELKQQCIKPFPSLNFISRILKESALTHRGTGSIIT